MDLVRSLLLKMESSERARTGLKGLILPDQTEEVIRFHLELMKEGGLVDHHIQRLGGRDGVSFITSFDLGYRPSMKGYEFLESVRDEEVWREAKAGASKVGGFTLDVLGKLAKGLIKKKIEEHTGLEVDI